MSIQNYLTETSWKTLLKEEFEKEYMLKLIENLELAYEHEVVYPPREHIFDAFNLTPFEKVKVVIIGQDPYHGANQAHGLCFSVQKGVKMPPSLINIFRELQSDLGITMPTHGNLEAWAKEGVLLLNAHLTVEAATPMAHKDLGWDRFTDRVIEMINQQKENVVFLLWGTPAQNKATNVDEKKHCVLKSVHPSPLSAYRGFLGCKHFSICNQYLEKHHKHAINWQV